MAAVPDQCLTIRAAAPRATFDLASWRCIVLSTVFMFLMVFWALALVFHLSGMLIPMVLVLTLVVLLLKLIIRRTSFN